MLHLNISTYYIHIYIRKRYIHIIFYYHFIFVENYKVYGIFRWFFSQHFFSFFSILFLPFSGFLSSSPYCFYLIPKCATKTGIHFSCLAFFCFLDAKELCEFYQQKIPYIVFTLKCLRGLHHDQAAFKASHKTTFNCCNSNIPKRFYLLLVRKRKKSQSCCSSNTCNFKTKTFASLWRRTDGRMDV